MVEFRGLVQSYQPSNVVNTAMYGVGHTCDGTSSQRPSSLMGPGEDYDMINSEFFAMARKR